MGDPTKLSEAINEIAELNEKLAKSNEKLKHYQEIAHTDDLTGVYNRRGFMRASRPILAQVIRSLRNDASFMATVLFLDVDGLKAVNDNIGHKAGDWVIQTSTDRIQKSLRETDILGRLGGDEFAVLLTDCNADGAKIRSQQIEQAFSETPFHTAKQKITLSISCGYHEVVIDGKVDFDEALRQADLEMYKAKNAKKGAPT